MLALVITRDARAGAAFLSGWLTLAITMSSPGNALRADALSLRPSLQDALTFSFLYLRGAFTPALPAYGLCFLLGATTGTIKLERRRLVYALLTFLAGMVLSAVTLFPVVALTGAMPLRALLPAQLILACTAFVIGSILCPKKHS